MKISDFPFSSLAVNRMTYRKKEKSCLCKGSQTWLVAVSSEQYLRPLPRLTFRSTFLGLYLLELASLL